MFFLFCFFFSVSGRRRDCQVFITYRTRRAQTVTVAVIKPPRSFARPSARYSALFLLSPCWKLFVSTH